MIFFEFSIFVDIIIIILIVWKNLYFLLYSLKNNMNKYKDWWYFIFHVKIIENKLHIDINMKKNESNI